MSKISMRGAPCFERCDESGEEVTLELDIFSWV